MRSGGTALPEPPQGERATADLLREPSGTASKPNQTPKTPKQMSSAVGEDEQLPPRPALSPHPAGHPGRGTAFLPGDNPDLPCQNPWITGWARLEGATLGHRPNLSARAGSSRSTLDGIVSRWFLGISSLPDPR